MVLGGFSIWILLVGDKMTSDRNLLELFCDWDEIDDDAELYVGDCLKLMKQARNDEQKIMAKEIFDKIDSLVPIANIVELEKYNQLKKKWGVK